MSKSLKYQRQKYIKRTKIVAYFSLRYDHKINDGKEARPSSNVTVVGSASLARFVRLDEGTRPDYAVRRHGPRDRTGDPARKFAWRIPAKDRKEFAGRPTDLPYRGGRRSGRIRPRLRKDWRGRGHVNVVIQKTVPRLSPFSIFDTRRDFLIITCSAICNGTRRRWWRRCWCSSHKLLTFFPTTFLLKTKFNFNLGSLAYMKYINLVSLNLI